MSFDIFLTCFDNGKATALPMGFVSDAIGKFVSVRSPRSWSLSFPDGGAAEIDFGAGPDPSGFGVNRPPGNPEFWAGMLNIIRKTNSALYWAGEGWAIGRDDTIKQIPDRWIKAHGIPTKVSSVSELHDLITRA